MADREEQDLMCGIAVASSRDRVEEMLEVTAHRGRDDRRIESWRSFHVGLNRLAIVDPSDEAAQPVATGDGVLAFNGEIYNTAALRAAIPSEPPRDSEAGVLAVLLRDLQEGFWRHLDGSYALVYVDKRHGWVVASRDFLGIVPLYRERRGLGIASEKKALRDPTPIMAGETVWMDDRGKVLRTHQQDYYSMHLEPVDLDHVERLFRQAVAKRIIHSDRPVCLALSGGIDSTLVLRAALDWKPDIHAITVTVDPDSLEVENARRVCAEWDVTHTVVETGGEQLDTDELEYMLEDSSSNPIKWLGFVRTYLVAKHAPGTVILCGEGADELGCGYPSHFGKRGLELEWKRLSTIRSMPSINLDRVNLGGMAWTREFRTPFLDRALVLYVVGCQAQPAKGLWRSLAVRMGVPSYVLDKPKFTREEELLRMVATR